LRRSVQLKFGNDVTALNSNGYIYIQSYNWFSFVYIHLGIAAVSHELNRISYFLSFFISLEKQYKKSANDRI
jgi:hypothetical protein